MKTHDVIIVGGGLSGLSLAYYLEQNAINYKLLEGRSRLGGRVFTITKNGFPFEMGATWFGEKHKRLMALVKDLKIGYKPQVNGEKALVDQRPFGSVGFINIPSSEETTYKFTKGSFSLIEALSEKIPALKIQLNCKVNSIKQQSEYIEVNSDSESFCAKQVIVCLPPNLSQSINFQPALKTSFKNTLHQTHTWMGNSVKIAIAYENDFWSNDGFTGTIFSNQQSIQELYQHYNKSGYGLVGFINQKFNNLSVINLKEKAIKQLVEYFGEAAKDYKEISILNWHNERLTTSKHNQNLIPHQTNGAKSLREPEWKNNLWFGASETAKENPGYMNGAVVRAEELAKLLLKKIKA
ncbi:flavin monoamine oxidase family protein [Psychroflexus sp. ALD_RP9]|uniref:flavin monoamine oxidase family protein n=1 Tax=Psychroflexus sp. ALD_RP9 TaxID=2777186 RepID=UPI001A8C27B9|nr:FAD-dependent oxidoreductase [Psychroflexus sp. ALD_RP9]QSS97502.1 FAD-dependent oxidoreductase [Psychroflexus sp. ALD_RP9]